MADEAAWDTHPSYGVVRVSRHSGGPVRLFDSPMGHSHTIGIQIRGARRKRELGHDFIYDDKAWVEVELSEAQWVRMVAGIGSEATPCTVRWVRGIGTIDRPPEEDTPLAKSMEELLALRADVERHLAALATAADGLAALPSAQVTKQGRLRLRDLAHAVSRAVGDALPFIISQHARKMEETVQRAKTEVDAHVNATFMRVGQRVFATQAETGEAPLLELPGEDLL